MKTLGIILVLFLLTAVGYQAQTVNGQFTTKINGSKYEVTISASMLTGTGTAGVVWIDFTYNSSALTLPATLTSGTDYSLQGTFASFSGNIIKPAANQVRVSINTTGTPAPVPLSTTPTNIITIFFTIADQNGNSNLAWTRTDVAPAFGQPNYTVGSWPNLSDPLKPPTVDGYFSSEIKSSKYHVTIRAKMSAGTGTAGIVSFEFTFNSANLSFPDVPVEGVDYHFDHGFVNYTAKNINRPDVNRINVSLATTGTPAPEGLTTTGKEIVEFDFTILNPSGSSDLTWDNSTISVVPNFGDAAYQTGSWTNPSPSPLPVELVSFNAVPSDNTVELNWNTATEVNNYGFEIERKNTTWEKIGFVQGHGNSNSPSAYSFTDKNPVGGTEFYYRIKQIDNDGKYKYYDPVKVAMSSPKEYKLLQNTPNPFNPVTSIKFQLPENARVNLTVYNLLGREVATIVNEEKPAGSHIVYWNGKDSQGMQVSSGIYLYRLQAGKFVETRKMNILK